MSAWPSTGPKRSYWVAVTARDRTTRLNLSSAAIKGPGWSGRSNDSLAVTTELLDTDACPFLVGAFEKYGSVGALPVPL